MESTSSLRIEYKKLYNKGKKKEASKLLAKIISIENKILGKPKKVVKSISKKKPKVKK